MPLQMTTKQIASWLRQYLDWEAELLEKPGAASATDYARPAVMGGAHGGLEGAVGRMAALRDRVNTVWGWLAGLSPVERVAADYYLKCEDGTVTMVAQMANINYQQARLLVAAIPLIIWSRHYAHAEPEKLTS